MASALAVLAIVLLYALALHELVIGRRRRRARTRHRTSAQSSRLMRLPGPKGLPIIGSVHQVPEHGSWLKFAQWAKQYGPIYQVNLAGSNHVWISTDKVARDLLAKKGAIYSDRPHIPALIDDNRTSAQYLPLLSKNEAWARQRRFAKHIMDESAQASFHRYPELEQVRLLMELIQQPSRYNHCLESYISRITCRLAWGVSNPSDELKQRARELLIGVSPTGALGNKLGFLMSLPDWLVPAKAWERRRARTERRFFQIMEEEVRDGMSKGHAPQSWMSTFLKSPFSWQFKLDAEGAYSVGMHGIAGALTIAAPMQTFCLAVCYYPQYQDILHEEVDRVCGNRRPQFSDAPSMPVTRAFIRESMRWRPPVPTGIPHEVIRDDEYEGYHIPAGSVMHPLEWSISREEPEFPNPEDFNPMRWLDPTYPTYREPLSTYPTMTGYSQFGYGRRVCMGQTIADADMFVGVAGMAWLFHISKNFDSAPAVSDPKSRESASSKISSWFSSFAKSRHEKPVDFHNIEKEPFYQPAELPSRLPTDPVVPLSNDAATDPTLRFSHLLIAKPLPFDFQLSIRNYHRAEQIRQEFQDKMQKGLYPKERKFWEDGGYYGWGAV